MTRRSLLAALLLAGAAAACDDDPTAPAPTPLDPATAPRVAVDRFSAAAATLFERTPGSPFPGPNQPIDMDQGPFITHGLGPGGQRISYYNFDVQSHIPADLYVLYRENDPNTPVANQLPIIDELPGEAGYGDFRRIVRVTVPSGYVANTVASREALVAAGYTQQPTNILVNYPVVPAGSTAGLRIGGSGAALRQGWYRNQVFFYFAFEERALQTAPMNTVPVAPIFVAFVINPGEPGGGPASGFLTEPASDQTHNVVAALPAEAGYSPLWQVLAYDSADFAAVFDLGSAAAATMLGSQGLVNCPVVRIQ